MSSFKMPALPECTCSYLLEELKLIWNEVGQDQAERERILQELEQCLEVYKRKVDRANISRVRLHQALADSEAEFTNLLISLGERSLPGRLMGTLKEQLDLITPALRRMQLKKEERVSQFKEVLTEIQKIKLDIAGRSDEFENFTVDESELSLKKLEEYNRERQRLKREKSDRIQKVERYLGEVRELAATMGMNSAKIVGDVHHSLDDSSEKRSKNISDAILERLDTTVNLLKDEKKKRMDKLSRLGKKLVNLWNLMDAPLKDRQPYIDIVIISPSASAGDARPESLTVDIIDQVESEVARLDQLKASKMKELFINKQIELEEICKKSHMELPPQSEMENTMNLIMQEMEHDDLLMSMEEYISKAKEEVSSRKDIMEKVEKWMASCNEERWLEEFSRDENRYSVSRGAHKNLKRAERARITAKRIPGLVEIIMEKTKIWETERKKSFLYDEVPLMAMLEEYKLLRQEKEEEIQRQREKKRVQLLGEKDELFRSRPGTSSYRIPNRSLNSSFSSTSSLIRKVVSHTDQHVSSSSIAQIRRGRKDGKRTETHRILVKNNSLALKTDTASVISTSFSGPSSP
ncbi:65-kDa microtubule-associated protein 8 isoform X2 [Phalaenopsis equestris]|uniref:65-kDa microtubule-associated protein 8 isoform X2 n=1 Tax=Phalaenopsis equestris TaxID=78828 RepID=UPI0009E35355|nr:65-kDa microtubule-associated protein 8 isoform X2 [Phalaenopsis equestris]